jgi:hypothetical protein
MPSDISFLPSHHCFHDVYLRSLDDAHARSSKAMAKFSYWQHIQSQWMWLPPVHHVDLSGQTVVVTGSNIGLGLETVKHLARMNPENIILAVRSTPKGEAVIPGELVAQQAKHQVLLLTNLQRSGMSPDIPATPGS